MIKINEIRALSIDDINLRLNEMRKELMKLNAQVARGINIKNSMALRGAKKSIAKFEFILNEKSGGKKQE